jgi:hypothetical protein
MLDGRIDTQGTVKDLRAQGILDDIAQDEAVQIQEENSVVVSDAPPDPEAELDLDSKPKDNSKKPRKLIKDEGREHGAVKWSIYNTYLKASCVLVSVFDAANSCLMPLQIILDMGHFELATRDDAGLRCHRKTVDQTMGPGLR